MEFLYRLVFAVALVNLTTTTEGSAYRYINIADTTMIGPTGQLFTSLSEPVISGGNVAFVGRYSSGLGIFCSSVGLLSTIVKTGDVAPSGTFGDLGSPAISGDKVALVGHFTGGTQPHGVFVGDGGPLTTIALRYDAAPSGTFDGLRSPSISGDKVALVGLFGDKPGNVPYYTGVFVGSGGPLTTIVQEGDPVPVGIDTFTSIYTASISGDAVVFGAQSSNGQTENRGIYVSSGGQLTTLFTTNDSSPFGPFTGFGSVSLSGDHLAFLGMGENVFGVFDKRGAGALESIVQVGEAAPDGIFTYFDGVAADGNSVAILARTKATPDAFEFPGIYSNAGGQLSSVIHFGDSLFGSTVTQLTNTSERSFGLDPTGTGNIVFRYKLADGRQGIAMAIPVPEPMGFAVVLITAVAISVGRTRSRRM